jgi:hypothetical protein
MPVTPPSAVFNRNDKQGSGQPADAVFAKGFCRQSPPVAVGQADAVNRIKTHPDLQSLLLIRLLPLEIVRKHTGR